MSRGVLFFNAGNRHGIHLIVSLMSLRDHYDGEVAIVCEEDGPGRDVAEWCAKDAALQPLRVIPDKTVQAGGHGKAYYSKTLLPRLSPFDVTIFIDADTLFCGTFNELWPDEASGEVVLTQFSDWVSTGGKMRQRILGWNHIDPTRVARMLEKPWPAINTGVMAWSRQSEAFAEDWNRTCFKRPVFMADETVAQIIFPDYNVRVMDDRFNASIVFPKKGETVLDREDVRILHGHGFKFWKRPQGRQLWVPSYLKALSQNRGNIQALKPMGKMIGFFSDDEKAQVNQYLQRAAA